MIMITTGPMTRRSCETTSGTIRGRWVRHERGQLLSGGSNSLLFSSFLFGGAHDWHANVRPAACQRDCGGRLHPVFVTDVKRTSCSRHSSALSCDCTKSCAPFLPI